MLDLYVTIHDETPEVMILDRDVLHTSLNLRRNHKCDRPLIGFVNRDWLLGKTAQHLRGVSLKLKCKLNVLHKTDER